MWGSVTLWHAGGVIISGKEVSQQLPLFGEKRFWPEIHTYVWTNHTGLSDLGGVRVFGLGGNRMDSSSVYNKDDCGSWAFICPTLNDLDVSFKDQQRIHFQSFAVSLSNLVLSLELKVYADWQHLHLPTCSCGSTPRSPRSTGCITVVQKCLCFSWKHPTRLFEIQAAEACMREKAFYQVRYLLLLVFASAWNRSDLHPSTADEDWIAQASTRRPEWNSSCILLWAPVWSVEIPEWVAAFMAGWIQVTPGMLSSNSAETCSETNWK